MPTSWNRPLRRALAIGFRSSRSPLGRTSSGFAVFLPHPGHPTPSDAVSPNMPRLRLQCSTLQDRDTLRSDACDHRLTRRKVHAESLTWTSIFWHVSVGRALSSQTREGGRRGGGEAGEAEITPRFRRGYPSHEAERQHSPSALLPPSSRWPGQYLPSAHNPPLRPAIKSSSSMAGMTYASHHCRAV